MKALSLGHIARKARVGVETVRFSVGCSVLSFRACKKIKQPR
jgi:hypothetical protein